MKIEIVPPSKVEVASFEVTPEGGVAITPLFYGSGLEAATAGLIKITNAKGQLLYTGMLKISGKGRPTLHDRTKTVSAVADKPKK